MKVYDLTFDIENDMPTCSTAWHQNVKITPLGKIKEVGRNTHKIIIGSHTGTHMDAPYHFIQKGNTIEMIDVNNIWGKIRVINFRNKGQGDIVTLDDVKNIKISERLLFVFGWYHNWKTEIYYKKFPYFSTEAIKYLIENGMKFMAMDTPSPDNGDSIGILQGEDSPNHKLLLDNQVVVVEYLNNTNILEETKEYEIVALPLKIVGSDGSPARVLIKEV